jgi:hypothetical protein
VNRATLHMAPVVVVWMLAVFRAWTQTLLEPAAPPAPAAEAMTQPPALPPEVPPPAPATSP